MVHRILQSKNDPSDLTDEQWALLAPRLPSAKQSTRGASPRRAPSASRAHRARPPRGGPERGDDGGKTRNGRKRQLLVERLGVFLAVLMTSAGLADGRAAPTRLGASTPHALPRLVTLCAEQKAYQHAWDAWMAKHRVGWRIEIKGRPAGTTGFPHWRNAG